MDVSNHSPPPCFHCLALITLCISPVGCLTHTPADHSLGKAEVNASSVTAYLRNLKGLFQISVHKICTSLLFIHQDKQGYNSLPKACLGCSRRHNSDRCDRPPLQLLICCLCSFLCANPQAWPFPPNQCLSGECSCIFIFLLLFLSVDQISGYFLNLLLQFLAEIIVSCYGFVC